MVKGYKVFNPDWTCRGFQYEVGKTYTHQGYFEVCGSGFHFCEKVADCFNYYDFNPSNKVAEIEAVGEVKSEGDKSATNEIRIVREISWEEMLQLANQGKGNTGHSNAGDYNAGHYNAGDYNAGHYNAGDYNAGHYNAGHYNAGHYNAGDYNAGNRNAGHYNAGDFNSCDYSSGMFCSITQPFYAFNKPCNLPRDEYKYLDGMFVARRLRVVDDEGNKIDYKQAWANLWSECSNSDKIAVQALPNFNEEVFFEITGIRV